MGCAAIGRVLAQLRHEALDQIDGDRIDAIVVVAELRKLSVDVVVLDETVVAADRRHFRVLDRRQAVSGDR
jgi:hypothetical protein